MPVPRWRVEEQELCVQFIGETGSDRAGRRPWA